MVTAAWSCRCVNVNSLPGKLVEFADDISALLRVKILTHLRTRCASLRSVESLLTGWRWEGRERNPRIQQQEREVRPRQGVVEWPAADRSAVLSCICVLNLTLPVSEREEGNSTVHLSRAQGERAGSPPKTTFISRTAGGNNREPFIDYLPGPGH